MREKFPPEKLDNPGNEVIVGDMPSLDDVLNGLTLRRVPLAIKLPIGLGLALALLVNVDPHWYRPGLVVSVAGLLLQSWTFGSVRSRKLVPMNGPYRFVRSPVHIAQFLLILGLVLMTGNPWVVLVYTGLYMVYAAVRVEQEEQKLEDAFGAKYRRYCKEVPRFVPRLRPYEEGRLWFFSPKNFTRQYGEIFLVVSVLLYVACYLAAFHF